MGDFILTGASRGIGRALALELARTHGAAARLLLVARDRAQLEAVAQAVRQAGAAAEVVPADLSTMAGARAAGARLKDLVTPGATLIHNAGLWPSRRALTTEGYESAYAVNHLGPLALQQPLLEAGVVKRILVVSAGLIAMSRFDPERTPKGADFSSIRTYCNTKLAFAVAMREVAAAHPEVDVVVLHPGVVRTDLGARSGPLGWFLKLTKRMWEAPEVCAARLGRILAQERWSEPGNARWRVEEKEQPWPKQAEDAATRAAVREEARRLGLL